MRVGFGFDAHGLDDSRVLTLGGVRFEDEVGLAGHSDADVLSHSVADALLGAARLGDLGDHFPDTEEWRDASSIDLLQHTATALVRAGWRIVNVDATVVAERPRLGPHRARMAENIAQALGVPVGDVSVKATSTDGLGFAGRREGIGAMAVVLVERSK
ncbi:MAG: 2-C-methyl-D-erythritol 2,4-cyclodiphosphate synthase [Actinomycetota bacterium]|jgi:2-C-methyl-D-erythritol 2,4-cyclodiphosphate synthase|nr:2-C-methyl-D-erythritol 2,4-cyclodiphosphate synthase [Actinomycetota bacterium]